MRPPALAPLGGTLGSPENLRFFARAAAEIDKPLFVGEIGYWKGGGAWDDPAQLDSLRATLAVIVELRIPLTCYWLYADDRDFIRVDYSLRYGKKDAALRLIESANAELRR